MSKIIPLITVIRGIDDPRVDRTKLHSLTDIIVIAICASMCGFVGWEEFECFAIKRFDWFKKFIPLKNGVPSHDTFRRVFERLEPKQLQNALTEWVKVLDLCLEGKVVAIDGKTLRSSIDKAKGIAPLHTISAWATEARMVLGECDVNQKTNEITRIPDLLEMLEIKGAIITIDAMGCQKEIADIIVKKKKADYVLALKKNHPDLYNEVLLLFKLAEYNGDIHTDYYQSSEKGHGRIETRTCICAEVGSWLGDYGKAWTGLKTVAKVISIRECNDRTTEDTRYYISSLSLDAKKIGQAIREHWGIENTLHWSLDVVYHEDSIHIRKDNSPKNLAIIRRIGFSLAKQRTPQKMTTKRAQLFTILDTDGQHQFFLKD